ncbi:MAG: imidazole glycerol phosphate synthase subunit HisH [Pontixanthobacter sp.]
MLSHPRKANWVAETIALIDYGAGNLYSVNNALKAIGATGVAITADRDIVARADRIVLPGVGSFKACAKGLRAIPGLVDAMERRVRRDAVPFLGICVGMQLLATRGLEHGETGGLDWIPGKVRAIEAADKAIKVPHMGWNDVTPTQPGPIAEGEAYFLHAYHFDAVDPEHIAAMTDHGGPLVAAVARDTMVGVQFHPEKSQAYGLRLLERFLAWKP